VSVVAAGVAEEKDGQRHAIQANVAPFGVSLAPRIVKCLGAWLQEAAGVVVEEERFAIGDVSAIGMVATDVGRRGAMGMLRLAIASPWAGQPGGGSGWQVHNAAQDLRTSALPYTCKYA